MVEHTDPNGRLNGWAVWGRHVMAELERLTTHVERQRAVIEELRLEIAVLQTRIKMSGALAGFVAGIMANVIAAIVVAWLKRS